MIKSTPLIANFGTRREFGRRQTSWHGWVKVRGRPVIPCVVKDFSDGGALVEFDVPEGFPRTFVLVIESQGFESNCETRHRTGNRMGVKFIAPDAVPSAEPDRFSYAALLAEAQKEQAEEAQPLEMLKLDPLG